jgi:hypothetical protein
MSLRAEPVILQAPRHLKETMVVMGLVQCLTLKAVAAALALLVKTAAFLLRKSRETEALALLRQ